MLRQTLNCAVLGLLLISLLTVVGGEVRAQPAAPVILAIGESTTAGFGVPRDKSWPAQLQALLDAEGVEYRVVNHGRSGSTTTMALSRLGDGLALQPKIVLIAIGGNDRSTRMSPEQTQDNLRRLVSMHVRAGSTVFLADRGAATDGGDVSNNSLYAALAEEEGALLMPSLREGIAGNAAYFLADMSHPNAEGYTIIAVRMLELIRPYLQ